MDQVSSLRERLNFTRFSGDHFESDDEDLEKIREEQVFALFYEAWVPLINRAELSPTWLAHLSKR